MVPDIPTHLPDIKLVGHVLGRALLRARSGPPPIAAVYGPSSTGVLDALEAVMAASDGRMVSAGFDGTTSLDEVLAALDDRPPVVGVEVLSIEMLRHHQGWVDLMEIAGRMKVPTVFGVRSAWPEHLEPLMDAFPDRPRVAFELTGIAHSRSMGTVPRGVRFLRTLQYRWKLARAFRMTAGEARQRTGRDAIAHLLQSERRSVRMWAMAHLDAKPAA